MDRLGVWIVGIYGSVASAVIAGAKLLARKLIEPVGLITELPEVQSVDLVPFEQMVFGGHDIRKGSIKESLIELDNSAHFGQQLIGKISDDLDEIGKNVCLGTAIGCSSNVTDNPVQIKCNTLVELVDKLSQDIITFRKRHNLKSVIVVNLSSTEPPISKGSHTDTLNGFENALHKNKLEGLRASALYAYIAFKSGCPYINFTPSAGASIPALMELAKIQGLPHTGMDGKTGETLIKSVLGGVFKYRALKVLSWQGYNILGNMDGKVLMDQQSKQSKLQTKDAVLGQMLGYKPHTHIGIDYVPSLGDWKVAWDFVHFEGFLGTKMNMQFIWQGCDSILAAPLVLDLIRLVKLSHRRGEKGVLAHLALFFKQPLGTNVMDLHSQWHLLWDYLQKVKEEECL